MDNSGTQKECVGRTYQGVDGYTPIAAYLGNEGWCVGLELRPGAQHSALETHDFLERVLPRVHDLVDPAQPVLARSDSGFDAVRLLFQQDDEKQAWAAEGRTFEYRVKWNPRRQDLPAWAAKRRAELSRVLGKRALKSFHPRWCNDRLFAGDSGSDQGGRDCRNQTAVFC